MMMNSEQLISTNQHILSDTKEAMLLSFETFKTKWSRASEGRWSRNIFNDQDSWSWSQTLLQAVYKWISLAAHRSTGHCAFLFKNTFAFAHSACFNCCSPIASASAAIPGDCVHFSCCLPWFIPIVIMPGVWSTLSMKIGLHHFQRTIFHWSTVAVDIIIDFTLSR